MSDTSSSERTFYRPRDGRVVSGVCAALARHYRLDAVLVRGITVVLALLGVGLVAYLALWLFVPEE